VVIRPSPALPVRADEVRCGDRYVDASGAAWVVLGDPAPVGSTSGGQSGMVSLRMGHTEHDPGMPVHFAADELVPVLRHRWMRAPGPGGRWVTVDPAGSTETHEGPLSR
jgi:hypothetical protein